MGDSNQTLVAGGVGTAFTIALLVFYKFIIPLFTIANHRRIRSVCCGRSCVSSLDVEETTPKPGSGVGAESGVGDPKVCTGSLNPIHTSLPVS